MKAISFSVLAIISCMAFSCREKRSDTKYYYPIDSLLHSQIEYLTQAKAMLAKQARIGEKEEAALFTPKDTTAWIHELDVFAQLNDINKATNVGRYRTERALKDDSSNLLIYAIESLDSATSVNKLPVTFVKVYYLNDLANIRKIEALYHEEGSLLNASHKLILEFQTVHNKIVLTSYSVMGSQKMLLADSVTFSVRGIITLP